MLILGIKIVLFFLSVPLPAKPLNCMLVGKILGGNAPHVIVILYSGRTEQQKIRLAEEIAKDIVAITGCKDKSVSVAIEEIIPENWAEEVYKPDILNQPEKIYKKPGYNPFK